MVATTNSITMSTGMMYSSSCDSVCKYLINKELALWHYEAEPPNGQRCKTSSLNQSQNFSSPSSNFEKLKTIKLLRSEKVSPVSAL